MLFRSVSVAGPAAESADVVDLCDTSVDEAVASGDDERSGSDAGASDSEEAADLDDDAPIVREVPYR